MTHDDDNSTQLTLAEESAKTLRDRKKLLAKFEEMDRQITAEALKRAAMSIRERINRLAPLRVPLGNSFELFDANRHPKELSERVKKIAGGISHMMSGQVLPPQDKGESQTAGGAHERH